MIALSLCALLLHDTVTLASRIPVAKRLDAHPTQMVELYQRQVESSLESRIAFVSLSRHGCPTFAIVIWIFEIDISIIELPLESKTD